jgi:hypothetical protein
LNRLILNVDFNYWVYNIDFEYTEKIENLHTKSIVTQHFPYSGLIHEFSVGIGLMIVLK